MITHLQRDRPTTGSIKIWQQIKIGLDIKAPKAPVVTHADCAFFVAVSLVRAPVDIFKQRQLLHVGEVFFQSRALLFKKFVVGLTANQIKMWQALFHLYHSNPNRLLTFGFDFVDVS